MDTLANPLAVIGSNAPPPFEGFSLHIDDLLAEANNFLDGEPITTQAQADAVSKLLVDIRRAANDADDARKEEKRPHDEAAKAVQLKWKPLLDRADLAVTTCKKAIAPFLTTQEEERRRAVEAAQQEASQRAEAARQAALQADPTNLADQTTVRGLHLLADEAQKALKRAEKKKPQAKGGDRAVSLRSVWRAEITDRRETLNHYIRTRPEDVMTWLQEQVDADLRRSLRNVPGVTYHEEKVAV